MRRRSRVASVRAVRSHQRHFGDVLPSLRRAARRPCGNGCSRCCAGGRDRSGEDACADETGRGDRPVDRRSGIRCRRQACSRVCAGTGIGCRAPRCILARLDAGGRSGSDDERRRTAGRSASSRCTAAARDQRYAGHRFGRRCADRSSARCRARPSPQDCFWSSPPPSITVTRARSFATRRRSRRCRSQSRCRTPCLPSQRPHRPRQRPRTIDDGTRTTDDVVARHAARPPRRRRSRLPKRLNRRQSGLTPPLRRRRSRCAWRSYAVAAIARCCDA